MLRKGDGNQCGKLEKAILVTNNDRVYEKYKDQMKVILLDGYEDVLIKVRDLVYDKHVLLTHPQASSLKPNQTPYRSVVVYPKGEEDNIKDIMLIDKMHSGLSGVAGYRTKSKELSGKGGE